MSLDNVISHLAAVDLFARDPESGAFQTGTFIGRPFYLDYEAAHLLVADAWKHRAHGVPQGTLLLAYYENEPQVREVLLLRVLQPSALPTDDDRIRSMIEYYKDNLKTSGRESQLDSFTRYEFGFSGLQCRILGTFYQDPEGTLHFGADVENFYSAHHYWVLKPSPQVLELLVNYRADAITGQPTDFRIGQVRYSSTRRFQDREPPVPVYVKPQDFLGHRTALFGMTRTGKSNTVKQIIQATVGMSDQAPGTLTHPQPGQHPDDPRRGFTPGGLPKYPVGQIIFDVNGEYANANLQDAGTAIFELFQQRVTRYSTLTKPGFKVLKVNFYRNVAAGFELIRAHLLHNRGNYLESFRAVDLTPPKDYASNFAARTRHDRQVAAYLCCLYRAGFPVPKGFKVRFAGNADLDALAWPDGGPDPQQGISLAEATHWFAAVWRVYEVHDYFIDYRQREGHEWADEDLKAILVMLTRTKRPGGSVAVDGYLRLRGVIDLHTPTLSQPFDQEIIAELRRGRIVIIDLSQGHPDIKQLYAERICEQIFQNAMRRFISNQPNNFVQFTFEEAHNLFPKRADDDLSDIYNRLAKEGEKLNLGVIYLTQEVSSISANILKNTQNWFIAHLNNADETREIRKYYDFGDFADSLVRFSPSTDRGFVRMKSYANAFVVPVQIDRFVAQLP
jgi:DNA helicase HerA-like ATPase